MGTKEGEATERTSPEINESHVGRKSKIPQELDTFTKATDSLVSAGPLALWSLQAAHRAALNDYTTLGHKCVNWREEDGHQVADVPPNLVPEYRVIRRRLERSEIATRVIGNSALVSLVSEYDSFLGGLLRAIFNYRPELLNASERTITLKELQTFASIDDVWRHVVEKEIETVIRKSHIEQFEWMETRFDTSLHKGLSAWPNFVEVTERRNLLVHTGGKVSSQYITVCQQHKADCSSITVGMDLPVTRPYLLQAYECLLEVGVKLAHVLWRKLVPAEREDADNNLILFCLDLMTEGRYELARKLLDFATSVLKKWHSEVTRRIFVVNRAQAYKWLNQNDTCLKILHGEDWSAVDDRLLLGVAVLKDDIQTAISLMRKLGDSHLVPKDSYREWPIFKNFRKTVEFKTAYSEIFGEEFTALAEHSTIQFRLEFEASEKDSKPLAKPALVQ